MDYLIDSQTQNELAALIDEAVKQVITAIVAHGNEEGLTSALGGALMQRSMRSSDLSVNFTYRQHNKITEEPHSGADGGFLVRVETPHGIIEKASLFQAKLLSGADDVRNLRMKKSEAERLKRQTTNMLHQTDEAVAIFYTWKNIYVVDAADYRDTSVSDSLSPLSANHRLITLGTYLGKWIPRCTKGDINNNLVNRARHLDGFKRGITMDVVTKRPAVPWEPDSAEDAWRRR